MLRYDTYEYTMSRLNIRNLNNYLIHVKLMLIILQLKCFNILHYKRICEISPYYVILRSSWIILRHFPLAVHRLYHITKWLFLIFMQNISSKHWVIGGINISSRTFTKVTMPCYYDSISLNAFRYKTDLSI